MSNSGKTKWLLGLAPLVIISMFLCICLVLTLIVGGGYNNQNVCAVDVDTATDSVAGGNTVNASTTEKAFIEKIARAAKADEYNIMPSLTIAQGILESAWGSSYYATTRNNLFGLGAYDSNPDNAYSFKSIDECVTYHDKILCAPPYGGGKPTGIEGVYSWGPELQAGLKPYATDPGYYVKLKNLCDKYNLTQYDDKNMAGKITSTNAKPSTDSKVENTDDKCIDSSPLSSKAVSMNINTNAKPYLASGGNPYAPTYRGECTWFAWGRFFEWYGVGPGFIGHGRECVDQLIAARGDQFKKVTDFNELKDKSIFSCQAGGAATSVVSGHVGCVEKVDFKKRELVVSEGNVDGKEFVVNTWSFEAFKNRYPNGLCFAVRR